MNTYRGIICFRILSMFLLALLLAGCLGGQPKGTPVPPATATASAPGALVIPDVIETTSPQTGETASPTSQPAEEKNATKAPTPTVAPTTQTQNSTQAAAPTTASAPVLTGEVYEPVPGCAPSRIQWGDVVRISPEIEYVRIRSNPDTHPSDNIIRRLYRTELAQTIGHPVCNYGWLLWPIQTADGTRGWVAESDGTDFWLVKAASWAFPTPTPISR